MAQAVLTDAQTHVDPLKFEGMFRERSILWEVRSDEGGLNTTWKQEGGTARAKIQV